MNRIKDLNEVLTGIFLILVGLLALYLAWPLSSSTDVGLGPGYVPKMFALIQLGLGVILIVNGLLQEGEASEPWHMRPLLMILASVAFFAVTIERLGLVIALTGLVLIACGANPGTKFREALILAIACAVVSAVLFVKLLGLSIALWPPMLWGN